MTPTEMSNEFDVLFNNVTSNQAPGLNEYEKSVFMTKAQNQLLMEYFNNRTDSIGGGFDGSQRRQYDFSNLIRTTKLYNLNSKDPNRIGDSEKLDKRSLVYIFPSDYFLAVNELISDEQYQYSVLPIDYAEYARLMLKPYAFPVRRGAWRIITEKKDCNFSQEYHTFKEDNKLVRTPLKYVLMTTWATGRKRLSLNIIYTQMNNTLPDNTVIFDVDNPGNFDPLKVEAPLLAAYNNNELYADIAKDLAGDAWSGGKTIYVPIDEVLNPYFTFTKNDVRYALYVANTQLNGVIQIKAHLFAYNMAAEGVNYSLDDELVAEVIKEGIRQYIEYLGSIDKSLETHQSAVVDLIKYTDGLEQFEMPATLNECTANFEVVTETDPITGTPTTTWRLPEQDENNKPIKYGHTFECSIKQVPMVEIIGKFETSNPNYQLRYVKALPPIILDDLSSGWYGEDVSIDGETFVSECALPEEAHLEVVERAVTLAKIAWSGNTATTLALAQRDNKND